MGRTPEHPVLLHDEHGYARAEAKAHKGREEIAAMMHLVGFRGRVLVPTAPRHTIINTGRIQLPILTTIFTAHMRRSETTRSLDILVSVTHEHGFDTGLLPVEQDQHIRIAGSAVFSEFDDTDSSTTALAEQVIPTSYPDTIAMTGWNLQAVMRRGAGPSGLAMWTVTPAAAISVETKLVLKARVQSLGSVYITSVAVRETPMRNIQ